MGSAMMLIELISRFGFLQGVASVIDMRGRLYGYKKPIVRHSLLIGKSLGKSLQKRFKLWAEA